MVRLGLPVGGASLLCHVVQHGPSSEAVRVTCSSALEVVLGVAETDAFQAWVVTGGCVRC